MSGDDAVNMSGDESNGTSVVPHSASTTPARITAHVLSDAQSAIVINAVNDVSRDGKTYETFEAALLAVVTIVNSEHDFVITADTVKHCIADAKTRLRKIRDAHKSYNDRLSLYEKKIEAEMAPFTKRKTRKNDAEIAKIKSTHKPPAPPAEQPLDSRYETLIEAARTLRERIRVGRTNQEKKVRSERIPPSATIDLSADNATADEKSDPAVEERIINGKKLIKKIRGNFKNMSREGLAELNSKSAESDEQIDRLVNIVADLKESLTERQERQVAAAEAQAAAVSVIARLYSADKENEDSNQPKRRRI
jgi:hypothetical protein